MRLPPPSPLSESRTPSPQQLELEVRKLRQTLERCPPDEPPFDEVVDEAMVDEVVDEVVVLLSCVSLMVMPAPPAVSRLP